MRCLGDASDITLFVGAGISVPSGAPNFERLRDCFLAPLLDGPIAKGLTMELFSPELLFAALDDGRASTRQTIRREMWRQIETLEPGPNHAAIAALGAAGARVWTTNFDTLIERAAERLGIPCTVVAPPLLPSAADGVELGRLVIIKPHGSFPLTGDPAREPAVHDYELLFRATDVWRQLGTAWVDQLVHDFTDRSVRLFGYRGADLDVVPALLEALPGARDTEWWEGSWALDNAAALERRFGRVSGTLAVRTSDDPSLHLQKLASDRAPRFDPSVVPLLVGPTTTSRPCGTTPQTWTARARIRGQFRGAVAARKAYARAIAVDPWELKRAAAWRLIRSTGYDRPAAGAAMLAGLRMASPIMGRRFPEAVWALYATLLDSRPLASTDEADLHRLRSSPLAGHAVMLVRIASKEKLLGRLDDAAAHLRTALDELASRERPNPPLEAMATYNLAWTERQRGALDARRAVMADVDRRLAHIGFNWAAWLQIDAALLSLDAGDPDAAHTLLDGPFLRFARERIRHPAYLADEAQAKALLRWHRDGPDGVEEELLHALRLARQATGGRLGFTAVDTLTLLGELARTKGRRSEMRRRLDQASSATRSALQQARIELVRTVAADDVTALAVAATSFQRQGFGLLSWSAEALLNGSRGTAPLAGLI
jgi:hypothetical protein